MRVMLKYKRNGSARFLSHLDMQRMFGRALRRSELPVAFSSGFNPHIIMSFASPLSVGYETEGDYLEIKMAQEIPSSEILERLSSVMPCGIEVIFASRIDDKVKKLMSLNYSADYKVVFEHDITEAFESFMSKQSVIAKDRKGRELDIRPYVLDGSAEKETLFIKLKNSSEQAMNPASVAALFANENERILFKRLECFAKTEDGEKPFYMIADTPE